MTINMGPQHPATHGVLRLLLELDGEVIVKAVPHIGYLHRGIEKLAESMTYPQALTLTDRLDYTSGLSNNLAYCLAVEKLLEIAIPKRAQYLRVLLAELQRIAAHLLWLATHALDLGAMTLLFYTFRDREEILEMMELVTGARLTPSFIRIGGLAADIPDTFLPRVKAFVESFPNTGRRVRDAAHGKHHLEEKDAGHRSPLRRGVHQLRGHGTAASGLGRQLRRPEGLSLFEL